MLGNGAIVGGMLAVGLATASFGQGASLGSAVLVDDSQTGPLVGEVSAGASPLALGGAAPLAGGAGAPMLAAVQPLAQGDVLPLGTPMSRIPKGRTGPGVRCTADGVHCIALDTYTEDVCRTLAASASEAGLDPHFFARLIWRESLFDANAVSHAGAQGIAQFMPGTAKERGLADPFNPAEALRASAHLLVDLRNQFGNLGMAAAAYNAGPGRVSKFLAGRSGLPGETRAYVAAITGFRGDQWRDGKPQPDYRLDGDTPFRTACLQKAKGRGIAAFKAAPDPQATAPWAAVLASHRSKDIVQYRYDRVASRLPTSLRGMQPTYVSASLPGVRGNQMTAQLGAESRSAARDLCRQATRAGVPCVVVRN